MTLTIAEVMQCLVLPLLGWLAWEIRNLRKEIGETRKDLSERIHVKECNRRMEEYGARLCALEHDEKNHLMAFHANSNNPTITREL